MLLFVLKRVNKRVLNIIKRIFWVICQIVLIKSDRDTEITSFMVILNDLILKGDFIVLTFFIKKWH